MELTSIEELVQLVDSQQELIGTLYKTVDEQQQQLDNLQSKLSTLELKTDVLAQQDSQSLTGQHQQKKGYFNL